MLTLTRQGIYCPAGDFYIDPSSGVETALITHAHGDHARPGSRRYLTPSSGAPLVAARLPKAGGIQGLAYGEKFRLGSVWVSFHPAGHILGSAQVRIEKGSEVWVMSGDYKRDEDPTCEPFESVPCNVFVTESTFGLPIYKWPSVAQVAGEIVGWWREIAPSGLNAIVYCYSLGKAQRLLGEFARLIPGETVVVHDLCESLNRVYREAGVALSRTEALSGAARAGAIRGKLILIPPGAATGLSLSKLGDFQSGFASGWMRLSRTGRSRRYDRGFVLSDHADWNGLLRSVDETGARRVYVMHGQNEAFARYLRESRGIDARPIEDLRAGRDA